MMRNDSRLLALGIAGLLALARHQPVGAQDFRLTIGPPVAAVTPATGGSLPPNTTMIQKVQMGTLFVVRIEGCPDPTKAQITATGEGLVNGNRQTVPLAVSTTPTSGVSAVRRNWTPGGAWVVNLVGTCQTLTAGAVVAITAKGDGFVRGASKLLLPRAATASEVDNILRAYDKALK